jgi:hypothetical protein
MRSLKMVLLFAIVLLGTGAADPSGASVDNTLGVIREFGFPVFVALWFMWRVEKRMDRFTEAIQNLLTAVTIMAKTVDGWHGPVNERAPTYPPERRGR